MLTIPKCWHIIHFLGKHRILIIINVGVAPRLFHINSLTCEFSAGTGKLCLCRWAWIYVQSAHNGRESTRCVLAHFPVLDDKTRVGDIIISICFKISLIGLCGGANSLPGTEVKTYSWQSPPPHTVPAATSMLGIHWMPWLILLPHCCKAWSFSHSGRVPSLISPLSFGARVCQVIPLALFTRQIWR